ncbi:AraC family transcriptional regulator [Actinobacteria bacterium YIM 96077]|uniref:AraC family transcriptional regulator n=1 Tax=Phytoactinopolyspora halophila TaxID=1981511 RepID=A0A329QM19_9ACTN|nr:AraC family transcriptional regulator [Phytoactinopolyspora halophila]AYY14671.1 AraC family transcriptional regulator [Actinobacteria bacterium YIM 96077]RAW11618.1 AraC family transcriptional regulator [Phytoactinopolyspora halophila]
MATREGRRHRGATAAIRAWRPAVPGITEVFHAHFVEHAYPPHAHDAWTLLIVDDGAIRYDLDRHHHGAVTSTVTLLPPHVTHDGRAASHRGFRKRVLYIDETVLSAELIGAAVDHPGIADARLRHRIDQLHLTLENPGDAFEAEGRLALIRDRLYRRLGWQARESATGSTLVAGSTLASNQRAAERRRLADQFRDLLDAHTIHGVTLEEASQLLHAHPAHLVRSFTRTFGLPPHTYATGRRVDLARRLLLAGHVSADVALAVGFYDQSHLNRHFTRFLGITPGRYARHSRGG